MGSVTKTRFIGFWLQDGECSVSRNLAGLRWAINRRRFTWLRDRAAARPVLTAVHEIVSIRVVPGPLRPPMMRRL